MEVDPSRGKVKLLKLYVCGFCLFRWVSSLSLDEWRKKGCPKCGRKMAVRIEKE